MNTSGTPKPIPTTLARIPGSWREIGAFRGAGLGDVHRDRERHQGEGGHEQSCRGAGPQLEQLGADQRRHDGVLSVGTERRASLGVTDESEEDVLQVDGRHQPVQHETVPGREFTDLFGRGVDDEVVVDGEQRWPAARRAATNRSGSGVRTREPTPASARSSVSPADRSSRPWASTSTWSAICSTSPSAWLDTSTVRP